MLRRLILMMGLIAGMLIAPGVAHAACTSPTGSAGAFIYNSNIKTFQYCNGANWIRTTKVGSGSGGCTSPTKNEGDLVYNKDYGRLQGCAGNVWRAMNANIGTASGGSGGGWVYIEASGNSSCGIKTDGTLWCWGSGEYGMAGDGATDWNDSESTPMQVIMTGVSGAKWLTVATGGSHACGLRDDGTAWCWGNAANGALGNGTTTPNQGAPQAVSVTGVSGTVWTQVATSDSSDTNCGIRDDGTAWCWGAGTDGEIGNGASSDQHTPAAVSAGSVSGTKWIAIDTGSEHACGIRDDGTMWCWGHSEAGQLGDGGSTGIRNTPQAVSLTYVTGTAWTQLSLGELDSCGVRDDGTAYCWGEDGDGTSGYTNSKNPRPVISTGLSGTGFAAVYHGYDFACFIRNNGVAYCANENYYGQLGTGDTINYDPMTIPVSTTGVSGSSWAMMGAGYDHSCGIRDDGSLYCFGRNDYGQLGSLSSPVNQVSPALVSTAGVSGSSWSLMDGSGGYCGIRNDGSGWCWGDVAGTWNYHEFFTPVTPDLTDGPVTGTAWTKITHGANIGCGIRDNGTMWCWGTVNNIGDGSSDSEHLAPLAVSLTGVTGANWTAVSGGYGYGCALRDDGTAYCWGDDNSNGQQGSGSTSIQPATTPVSVTGVTGTAWTSIIAGSYHSCGIRNDGSGWCWGDNTNGKLGNGNTTQQTTPALVSTSGVTGTAWISLEAGYTDTCGVRDDGTGYCWGSGSYGAVGNGLTTGTNSTPKAVTLTGVSGASWTRITTGGYHSCGVRDDGTGYCWGRTSAGALGNGVLSSTVLAPTPINTNGVSGTGWSYIIVDRSDTAENVCGMRNDNTVWCWGSGYGGSIGNGVGISLVGAGSSCGMPTGAPGQLAFNGTTNRLQLCNGVGWIGLGPLCKNTPSIPTFTALTAQSPVTAVQSNIVQVTGLSCMGAISVSGSATPMYRVCPDATCSTSPSFTASAGTISNGQYVQLQQTTSNTQLTGVTETLAIDGASVNWTATTQDWKWVFLTSAAYTPGTAPFTSYASGDTICASLASAQSLPGTYKAWLSTPNAGENPAASFASPQTLPYRLLDAGRSPAFGSLASLLGGASPSTRINTYETGSGGGTPTAVWTNTSTTGTSVGTSHCTNWTGTSGNGRTGSRTSTSSTWTTSTNTACTSTGHLYCFQQ